MIQPKRRVPLGQPLDWTEQALDRLSQISPENTQQAEAFWRQTASKPLRDLLDATPEGD